MDTRHHSATSSTLFSPTPRAAEFDKSTLGIDSEKAAVGVDVDAVDEYPDGGLRAWLVVLGVRLTSETLSTVLSLTCMQVTSGICATFGFINAWGVS